MENVLDVGTNLGGEDLQDADDLAAFGGLEFANAIVGVDDGGGFDEYGFAGGALIVDDALDLALEGGSDGDDEAAVAEGGRDVATM